MRQLLKAEVQVVSTESFTADACSSLRRLFSLWVRVCLLRLSPSGPQTEPVWTSVPVVGGGQRLVRLEARLAGLWMLGGESADGCRRIPPAPGEKPRYLQHGGRLRTGQNISH